MIKISIKRINKYKLPKSKILNISLCKQCRFFIHQIRLLFTMYHKNYLGILKKLNIKIQSHF